MKTWKIILMVLAILFGWIGSVIVICKHINSIYYKIADRKGWFFINDENKKNLLLRALFGLFIFLHFTQLFIEEVKLCEKYGHLHRKSSWHWLRSW